MKWVYLFLPSQSQDEGQYECAGWGFRAKVIQKCQCNDREWLPPMSFYLSESLEVFSHTNSEMEGPGPPGSQHSTGSYH